VFGTHRRVGHEEHLADTILGARHERLGFLG